MALQAAFRAPAALRRSTHNVVYVNDKNLATVVGGHVLPPHTGLLILRPPLRLEPIKGVVQWLCQNLNLGPNF